MSFLPPFKSVALGGAAVKVIASRTDVLKNVRSMELSFFDDAGRAQADVGFDLEKVDRSFSFTTPLHCICSVCLRAVVRGMARRKKERRVGIERPRARASDLKDVTRG